MNDRPASGKVYEIRTGRYSVFQPWKQFQLAGQ
jgi:hypothetical protein